MEQLYPLNIIERRYPIFREQREKAEREAEVSPGSKEEGEQPELEPNEASLYEPIPYTKGSIGMHLNTLA